MKTYAMIPARVGSKRVPGKNFRTLGGKPLVAWAIEACIKADVFDGIWLNSDGQEFRKIANDYGARFYLRDPKLAEDTATNDQFAEDFIINTGCNTLCQVNPTSPFIKPEEIVDIMDVFRTADIDTLHTVKNIQIECMYNGIPLNYDPKMKMPPSQDLIPVQAFTSSVMVWDSESFLKNMLDLGCAVYGGKGNIGYYPLKGYSTLDIDEEEDFKLAEAIVSGELHENQRKGCAEDIAR